MVAEVILFVVPSCDIVEQTDVSSDETSVSFFKQSPSGKRCNNQFPEKVKSEKVKSEKVKPEIFVFHYRRNVVY